MDIIREFEESEALLTGHFLLSSGKHSDAYVQCAKLLQYPDRAKNVVKVLAKKAKDLEAEVIVGPAMGGIVVAYELGRQMGLKAIFTEREDGEMKLRRGFSLEPSQKVIISEDVVTTGKSSKESLKVIEEQGAEVVALCTLVDRTGKDNPTLTLDDGRNVPIISAIKLDINTYDKENCPLCEKNIELVKPGSRKIKG